MKVRPLPLALLALALSPASALATPHWSTPVDVIAGSGADTASPPAAYIAPSGTSWLIAGSGAKAMLAKGGLTGAFDAPTTLVTSGDASIAPQSAVAPDGRIALAWTAGGSAHATLVSPNDSPLPTADLPGSGVNALDVAFASDGSELVAYRTKESANSYTLNLAIAPPGSTTFSAPVTIDSGAATNFIDVATGPNGAAAIAYRRLTGSIYRARVAVRPPGAAAFEPGQPMSSAGAANDYSPRVAFDSDGTVVAAWSNPGGAMYALRPPGTTAFGAGIRLGSGASYGLDLEPTPTGTAAMAFTDGDTVRAALQSAPGSGFSAPVAVGPQFSSNYSNTPAVAVTPAGTVTVVSANPVDGTIHASDVGGADTVIGYGHKDAPTAVAVTAGSDRTVAAWLNAAGTVQAATRSEQAIAPSGPDALGQAPSRADTRAPKLRFVSGSKRVKVTARTKRFTFKVRCDEACKLLVTGSMRTQLKAGKRKSVAPLPAVMTKKPRAGVQTVTIKLGSIAQKDLRTVVRRGRGALVYLSLEASDAANNAARTRLELSLRPTPKKRA
jgi:hypothetical protein